MTASDEAHELRMERLRERADDGEPRQRVARGCWCGLEGYPGRCPGPERCPYSGYHDDEGEQ